MTKKYIITWNCGYGENWDLVEAENCDEAFKFSQECWREDAESNAEYGVKEFTRDEAENYGFTEEHREMFPDEWGEDDE